MKSQVTIDYTSGTPRIDTILMSVQHDENIDMNEFKNFIHKNIMQVVARSFSINDDFNYQMILYYDYLENYGFYVKYFDFVNDKVVFGIVY